MRIFSGNSPGCHRTASGTLCGELGKAALGAHTGPAEEGTMDTSAQKLGDSPSERQSNNRTQVSQEREQRGGEWVLMARPMPHTPPPPSLLGEKQRELLGLLEGTLVSILERSPPAGGERKWQRRETDCWQEGRAWQWLTTNALLKQERRPFHGLPCSHHGAHFPV